MKKDNWKEQFLAFHNENPKVYSLFKKLAMKMKATGRQNYGAWTLFNVIRWDFDLNSKGDAFKINNNYIAFYSRMLVEETPEFEGFFRMREMKHG